MLKEKINSLLNTQEGNSKKKIENLIFLLVILIITVIAINYIWNDKSKSQVVLETNNKETEIVDNSIQGDSSENLEAKLENILSKISGVGKADVMLTYNESTQVIPIYNKKEKISNTDESDSGGGTRKIKETDSSEEVVYTDSNGKNQIATQKTVSPKIEGAIIIAEGADEPTIKTNIIQAVEAATGLATHKIQVFRKQN